MKSLLAAALLAAGTVGWAPGQARADLIGDTVHVTYRGPNFGTVSEDAGTQTIAAGTVFNFPVALVSITFSASQITIADTSPTGFSPATFNGPDLAFLSGPAITNATEDAASTPAFATGSVVSFSANDINVNLANTCSACVGGEQIILDVTTAGAAVPEPASLALFGTALFGFGVLRRRSGAKPGMA